MRRSQLFISTRKQTPADEESLNAQLLIRAGFVHKEMAGVYDYLPLGFKVLENIKQIVREEMNAIGGQELIMTNLQRPDIWQKTGRWDEKVVDVWFKTHLQDGSELGLAWSHEEPILAMMQQFIQSYKDLPASVYQFQTKLRNELRAKSGIMRGREFVMKDMYSLHTSAEDLDDYYNKVIEAYKKVYERLGIGKETFVTFASGGAFTKFSHEFQTICDAGEDVLYLHRGRNIAVNEEVLDEAIKELNISKDELEVVKSAEVGNIFNFGSDKAQQMGVYFSDAEGQEKPVYLASYGIGITRLMGVIAEKFADERGLVWPVNVAPYHVYLCRLGDDPAILKAADEAYEKLKSAGIEVLYDDRGERPGEQFADADLLGLPFRLVVSAKSLESGGFELKSRSSEETQIVGLTSVIQVLGK
ncbi:MAG TPA: aminoacyl--tRNA ligase-related protein [Candidatus Saccharimonadales bacterium]|nr:aminoacyl--tRNA ligase-related protein [Candidatus Saccharimonadales bacterium]